jgi:excinuclease UvrABC nuclease subunit
LLVDGGKAQFNVAKQIIQNNKNFKNTKIGALAKGKQNLFIDNSLKPIALKQLPLETKLFLMSLQDEAHRFAVSYYHIVYRKRNLEGKVY